VTAVWDVPGQPRAAEVLAGAAERGEVSHAWAFIGPAGVGQERAAHALTAALNCTEGEPGRACGTCSVCTRALRGAFSAYQELVPTGGMHRVDDVRGTWLRAAVTSLPEGSWKVLRVVDADRMNDAAANAFLKGLEEPPPQTVWILDMADPDELPETILSRCRVLPFSPWGPDLLAREGAALGLAGADLELAVRVADGAPAALRRLARPAVPAKGRKEASPSGMDDLRRHREIPRLLRQVGPGYALTAAYDLDAEVKRTAAAIEEAGEVEIADLAARYGDELPAAVEKQLKDRTARRARDAKVTVAQAALDDLAGWYRDVVLVASGGDPALALHRDVPDALRADAEALGAALGLRALDLVFDTRERLERNVQQRVTLEALLIDLATLTLAPVGR
jgi:DNA polymerase III subunit delta'